MSQKRLTKTERAAVNALLMACGQNADPDWTGRILKAIGLNKAGRRVIKWGAFHKAAHRIVERAA